jgi:hypothetical protein
MLSESIKSKIRSSFKEKSLEIVSSDKSGVVTKKKILDVYQHFCPYKKVFKIKTENKQIVVTEDHSLYVLNSNSELEEIKPNKCLKEIAVLEEKIYNEKVFEVSEQESRDYMYDLSVEKNENFFLTNGILAHNSFSAPSKEGTIAGLTRTRGFRWGDDSLYMHLVQACNYLNLIPPDTSFDLQHVPAPWQPLLLLQAMSYALYDLAILWINEEFSYSLNGISLDIQRSDKYMNAAQTLQSQVDTQMTEAKRRLHYTIGLRQSRYTMSMSFLGPNVSGTMNVKKWVMGFGTQADRGFSTGR